MATTDPPEPAPAQGDAGSALVVVLLLGLLLGALGASAALLADVDTLMAGNHRDGLVIRHAAEGVADIVVRELAWIDDWTPLLTGAAPAAFAGGFALPPSLGGSAVDAVAMTADVQRETYGGNPWGADTPRWRLYAHGVPGVDLPFSGLPERAYALVWVSDDVAETDGAPLTDANGVIVVRARVMGPGGSRSDVQLVIARVAPGIVQRVSSRVIR